MKYSEFYLAFENEFRGSSLDVQEKLAFYDDLLQEVSTRFIHCSLLDIGCGRGEWLLKCKGLGINSVGIDSNDSMFNICRDKGLNIKYGEAIDILKTIENNSFHIISSFHFIEHISFNMFLEILEECKRILIPGGVLIFETPSIDNILVSAKDFYLDPTHVTHMHPETIIFALKYFKFTESKYFLINKPSYQKYGSDSINSVINGAGLDVSIIASYNINNETLSIFDQSLNWINKLNVSKNTFEISNQYDSLINEKLLKLYSAIDQLSSKIENLSSKIKLLDKQIEPLLNVYEKIFNSLPLKVYRKIKSLTHLIKAVFVRLSKLLLSKALKIYLFEKVYFKIDKFLFQNKLDLYTNAKNNIYLNKLFESTPRSEQILLDLKTKTQTKTKSKAS